MAGGEGSTGSKSFRRLQWWLVVAEPIPADSVGEEIGRGLGKAERECVRAGEACDERDGEPTRWYRL